MRITHIHIDGYGAFENYDIGPIAPGLSIVLGHNEAGKSTLLDFIRGVLFGFADGRSPRSQHRPLRGGKHGGRLIICDDNDVAWTIERYAGRPATITSSTGEQVGASFLLDLLGHTDRQVFESIFAFGLDELGQAERLHDENVRERIFSAGVLGTGRSASAAIKQLDEERSEITRNTRAADQKNRLYALSRRRDDITTELRVARQSAKAFERLSRDISKEQRLAEAALGELLGLQQRKKELDDLEFASSSLETKAALERELSRCSPIGEDQLRLYNERRRIEELIARFEAYRQNREDLQTKIGQQASRHEKIDELLPATGVDAETCNKATITIAMTSEIDELVTAYQHNQTVIELLSTRSREAEQKYSAATRQFAEATKGREALDQDVLRQQHEDDIPTLRKMVSDLREIDHRLELRRQERSVSAYSDRQPVAGGWQFPGMIALLGAAAIVLAFFISSVRHVVIAVAILGALVLIAGVVGLILNRRGRAGSATSTGNDSDPLDAQRTSLAIHVADLARSLGLTEQPVEGQIEAKDRSIGRDLHLANDIEHHQREVAEAKSEVDATAVQLGDAHAQLQVLIERSSAIGRELGLRQEITPPALKSTVTQINEIKKLLEADRRSADPMKEHQRHIDDYQEQVVDLFTRCGRDQSHPDAIEHRLTELHKLCGEIAELLAARETLSDQIAAQEDSLAVLLRRDGDHLYEELALSSQEARDNERSGIAVKEELAKEQQRTHLQTVQELQRNLTELQGSTSIGDLEVELDSITTEISAILRRWSLLGLSGLFLKKTLQRYELERQPAVIARAGELFSQVTDGKYSTLIAREDAQGRRNLEALCPDHTSVEAQFLSKGAAEQLYLCVRLAYAATFAESSVAIPLVFDDVLVNFDPLRTRQMVRAITNVADNHQVLLFTCHPHTAEQFTSMTNNVQLIELDR